MIEDPLASQNRDLAAENCIKKYVLFGIGAGLIPAPLVDAVAITALEISMIGDLAAIYEFPVPHRLVSYKVLISLIGSIGPIYLATKVNSAIKAVPFIGHALYFGIMSFTGGASVYAVGKLFQKHFVSGGTFLSGDPTGIRSFFREKFAEGKALAPTLVPKRAS